jgi:CBS domain-containing protein
MLFMHGKKCSDVMTKDITCCLQKDTVNLAAQSMKAKDIGAVPVVDGHQTKKLVGIVTDRDLALKVVAEGLVPEQTRIEDVMARNLVMCRLQDDLQLALDAMSERQLRRIPVVDDQGRLVGIIAQADLARIEEPAATGKVVKQISRPTHRAAA